jgi:hypothetical protein
MGIIKRKIWCWVWIGWQLFRMHFLQLFLQIRNQDQILHFMIPILFFWEKFLDHTVLALFKNFECKRWRNGSKKRSPSMQQVRWQYFADFWLCPFSQIFCTCNSWISLVTKHRQQRINCVRNSMYCSFLMLTNFGEILRPSTAWENHVVKIFVP